MLIGAFGAALIRFLTPRRAGIDRYRATARPAAAGAGGHRGIGRAVGLFGWDGMGTVGALANLAWIGALIVVLLHLSLQRRTDGVLSFAFGLFLLMACTAAARRGLLTGDIALAGRAQEWGLVFLGLVLARITVPVTNLVLEPTGATSPFRPHPGRLNLAHCLVLVALAGDVAGLSSLVTAFLMFGTGGLAPDADGGGPDGRAAGSRLGPACGADGGLGLAVQAVDCIAGRLHSGRTLGLTRVERRGALALVAAVGLRAAPGFGWIPPDPVVGLCAIPRARVSGVCLRLVARVQPRHAG